ncbi:sce7726 family protein [Enterobacter hormaechei subsp. steigerwaltii]|uniref:sce7726 family protein n=1 Tax=Enterobacter hormaechei TaxID=158836 RepID=UPI000792B5EF|nr:sce7726 family protein [Enterobacter hormaechei]MCC9338458.1 sce7726 family protein [Enterobacter hormaechei subsp. steigerwaltii]MCC9377327.1 sce7726 family protein [Enterobacter hormaechei subsp. steigerwaltii]MCC9392262.1 sce7726 family protein [Enterobacter hormaechei subsp. steigerwaltii]MCC9418372.1 sce7726 family protein [Enterobacter hormaechei subsp. steigerwaltii]MCD0213854.1 sce7726 family protein [Enterobacter hormaechei subsp. steigerwaltii]
MSVLLREQDVKVAFIDWLFRKGLLENATIINEMVVANWSRRADLAVANGHLQAFEIKSDFDSLKRLDGQLETFTSRFEKVTVVCAPKFTYEISKKVTSDVGVIEYLNTSKGIRFKIVQRGRTAVLGNKKVYINFLLKKELQLLLVESGKRFLLESGREALERIAEQIPLSRIRDFALKAIKQRYKETSDDYLNKLAGSELSNANDLILLSKSKKRREHNHFKDFEDNAEEKLNNFYTVDIEGFMRKHGEVGSITPIKVLKRVVR